VAMLYKQGAKVSGIALNPPNGGIFEKAAINELLADDIRLDIRDSIGLQKAFQLISPDVVIHLAAQPIVLASYQEPRETFETNVIGTLNVLEAVEATYSVEAALVVTTDKVYKQDPLNIKAFVESDELGSSDPYSTSKAMADLLTQSWIASHPDTKIGIARAGNVIGGGDVAENRILPDLVRAFSDGTQALVRNPKSVRPWQHVLDCLAGYVSLTEGLLSGFAEPGPYNFGPEPEVPICVEEVAAIAAKVWGDGARWIFERHTKPFESQYLALDSSKSKAVLGWREKLSPQDAIVWSITWSKNELSGQSPRSLTFDQITSFTAL